MTDEQALAKIQALANEEAKNFIRPAQMQIIYSESQADGTTDYYVLGSDMPNLVYRIFVLGKDDNFHENGDIRNAVEKTRHFNQDIKPSLKLVPPAIEEGNDYEILVENPMEGGGVEVKLKSTTGRNLTMIEVYRYFDYVSKIFFVSCVGTSFGGSYLFSVTPDSKHLRLILGRDEALKARVDMINELLQARLLPSYKTVKAASELLSGNVKAHIQLKNNEGETQDFDSTFCYDDPETQTRYAFFANSKDAKQGIILVDDVLNNNRLYLSDQWTEQQKAAVDRFKKLMTTDQAEFQKHVVSFFADDLDFRYAAYKSGKIKAEAPEAPKPAEEKPAEEKPEAK